MLLLRLQESGLTIILLSVLGGMFLLRCCFVNYRTQFEYIDLLVALPVRMVREVLKDG
jgi:hypothetical protein